MTTKGISSLTTNVRGPFLAGVPWDLAAISRVPPCLKKVERLFYRNLFLTTLFCIVCSYCRYTSCKAFQNTLNEMSDYAGQHEVISENMSSQIMTELIRFVQELKQERKSVIFLMLCLSCLHIKSIVDYCCSPCCALP